MDKSIEDLEREITCAVCQEHYTQPKVLPCLHYYCEQCICRLSLRKDADSTFSCPECRQDSKLPEGGVEELPTAFFVNRLMSTYYTLEKAHGKKREVKCEVCAEAAAEAEGFCRQCSLFLCTGCMQSHWRLKKIFDGHEVVDLRELKEEKHHRSDPPSSKCLLHKKLLVAYCLDCNSLICHSCTTRNHRDHKFNSVSVAAPRLKEKLLGQLDPMRQTVCSLSSVIKEIQSNKLELESHLHSMTSTVKISFQELHTILENREKQLLCDIEEQIKSKMSRLSDQNKSLEARVSSLQSVLDDTEHCVKQADDSFMLRYPDAARRVSLESENHGKPEQVGEPVEEIDIMVKVNCAEALKQLCQSEARIAQLPVNVLMEELKSEKFVDKPAVVDLKTMKLSTNKLTTRSLQLECQLKSLHNGSITKCETESLSSGHYRIHFTPTVRGRNELLVSIEDEQVRGSPLPIFVSVSPVTFKKPVSSWKGMKQPSDVIINSAGEIIVTEFGGDILIFDQGGNKLRSIEHTKHASQKLIGAAVDDEGNIYFVGPITNKIYKYEVSGDTVLDKIVERENVSGHRSVELVGDEVMVCEQSNKSIIAVYDKDLNFVRQIVNRDFGTFIDITADLSGNIYVTCWANTRVQVFDNNGKFLHSFGLEKPGSEDCLSPRYLCVTDQLIYVTDNNHSDVSVFSKEGNYITSFGQGYFIIPHGVCVDQDGFVYVCDFSSSKILVF